MYSIQLEFSNICSLDETNRILKDFDDLFHSEQIKRELCEDNYYKYVTDRVDDKVYGSYWAVLFKIKRYKYNVQKIFSRFEWVYFSNEEKEIREDLLKDFFEKNLDIR